MSYLEKMLDSHMKAHNLPEPKAEYRFAAELVQPGRGVKQRLAEAGLKDWRFDFAWPDRKLAVEVEGGAFVGGRHTRGAGFSKDLIKYHHAAMLGWLVYRCDAAMIRNGMVVDFISQFFGVSKVNKHGY